ncbi:hypothetical protein PVAND_010659 [Polypedilum vanderplanki]|uniref:Uncharacterized protein n=1 Tax=Polypedilum vanderplanki TaxID=319348 RepID=A0A9J6CGA0_POLVA|nr:hypothetical protein PVAND_010659 [Polypedilum vanderplanki]
MVLMKYFCFCIPVRLGVIITSILDILNRLLILGVSLYYSADDIKKMASKIRGPLKDNMFDDKSKEIYEELIDYIKDYPSEFRWFYIVFSSSCIIACIINILASLTKFRWLSIPYIILGFIHIAIVLTVHVNYMLMMKKEWNLGILIAASCAGGFFILLLLYLWGVTVAMFQIIGIVNSKEYQESLARFSQPVTERVKNPKIRNIATIATEIYHEQNQEMLARDFYGVYKKTIRRI